MAQQQRARQSWTCRITSSSNGATATTGYGIMVTISVLYFVRSVDLSAERVGLGMTID